ncbi:P-loop containing nucleoside triphosphate hydrolase protein [Microdochium trichocladiopsis]|uniref:Kinesin-like protein n=1 Tax=Microdochium trichocladiopsis TaxID=1682393 RepID=A0A9P8XVG8_9PEZI|nr:P-loop containing nucleoside triphosphate hydrolase protein [Microdochium trichocladiopsis]KAH7020707.1 P-loop containing nucleoside triphosphate hydrolase protein [Microdochium trichocladiopsis]
MARVNVFARWRPLSGSEAGRGEIGREAHQHTGSLLSVSVNQQPLTKGSPWTSPAAFNNIFEPEDDNYAVYTAVVAPHIPRVLRGENCTFFAYGHSGSGKTHTILGYEFEDPRQLGMCLGAARQIFDGLQSLDREFMGQTLGIGFSLFELRRKAAFDLLNNHTQCHIREGPDGQVHVRGETEILDGGKVRVRPIVQRVCWDFGVFREKLIQAVEQRATGSSSIHDQSSRTHAILQLEVVSQALIDARFELLDRQSELVPVGKRATDISIEEESRGAIRTPDGRWVPNPNYQKDQARIDAIEAEKAQFEARVADAERKIGSVLESSESPALGAKLVFVDLAGAEYYEENGTRPLSKSRTSQELQESRQINSDLLALKEVMRAWSQGRKRIPFRASTLTMVLREHFTARNRGASTIITTISPALDQYVATLNSLKYASLVGAADV